MQKINILTKIKDSFEPLIPYEKFTLSLRQIHYT